VSSSLLSYVVLMTASASPPPPSIPSCTGSCAVTRSSTHCTACVSGTLNGAAAPCKTACSAWLGRWLHLCPFHLMRRRGKAPSLQPGQVWREDSTMCPDDMAVGATVVACVGQEVGRCKQREAPVQDRNGDLPPPTLLYLLSPWLYVPWRETAGCLSFFLFIF
jgi:hypothetical protein